LWIAMKSRRGACSHCCRSWRRLTRRIEVGPTSTFRTALWLLLADEALACSGLSISRWRSA
jgi:hypothetical protein